MLKLNHENQLRKEQNLAIYCSVKICDKVTLFGESMKKSRFLRKACESHALKFKKIRALLIVGIG